MCRAEDYVFLDSRILWEMKGLTMSLIFFVLLGFSYFLIKIWLLKNFMVSQEGVKIYNVPHIGWDFRDDCTEFVLYVSFY